MNADSSEARNVMSACLPRRRFMDALLCKGKRKLENTSREFVDALRRSLSLVAQDLK